MRGYRKLYLAYGGDAVFVARVIALYIRKLIYKIRCLVVREIEAG